MTKMVIKWPKLSFPPINSTMFDKRNSLSQSDLQNQFYFNAETGLFIRKKTNEVAGYLRPDGYISISVNSVGYLAHRLVWVYLYGYWPVDDIDHINGNRSDNRLENLRLATRQANLENKTKAYSNNTTGLLGVSRTKEGRYRARICLHGKQTQLGEFDTPEEAYECYLNAKRTIHKYCTI